MNAFLGEYRGTGPLRDVTGEWERSYMPRGRKLHGESPYFLAMNRNKLAVTADLNDADDRAFIQSLVAKCDVVVENFRPGVMDRLGMGYEQLLEFNPRLVYASGSGYGAQGPLVKQPGQDMLLQSMSGLAANTGPGDGPPVPLAAPVLDASTAFLLAFSIVSAVMDARENGTPHRVQASLLGTALMIQCQEALVAMNTDLAWQRSETGIAAPWTDAPYGVYRTQEGFLAMSMTPRAKLAEIFSLPQALVTCTDDEWFLRRDEVNTVLKEKLLAKPAAEWVKELTEKGMWVAPVNTVDEIVRHPQVAANGLVEDIDVPGGNRVRAIGMPVSVSGIERANRLPVPTIGEHNDIVKEALKR
jgi:crotonobetainyl-CoA:carnitine CoA-transferase CaiB-like acyl-CoA transferase